MADYSKLITVPGLVETLKWLMDIPSSFSELQVINFALRHRLIENAHGDHWSANTQYLEHLVDRKKFLLPRKVCQLAAVLSGLGEMSAHSHASCYDILKTALRTVYFRSLIPQLLDEAVILSIKSQPQFQKKEISTGQMISRYQFDWDALYQSMFLLEMPYESHSHRRYGLTFILKLAFYSDAYNVSSWCYSQGEKPILAAVLDAVVDHLYYDNTPQIGLGLLRGRNHFLKCLAAASVVCPQGRLWNALRDDSSNCISLLEKSGITPGDIIWVVGLRLKEELHGKFRLEHQIQQDQSVPQIQELQNALTLQDDKIEKILTNLARAWPVNGIGETQLKNLDNAFIDKLEFRFRLAEKVTHEGNQQVLLGKNTKSVFDRVGCSNKDPDFLNDGFYYNSTADDAFLFWGAKSHILRWIGGRRGVGRKLGDEIIAFADIANGIIEEPYAFSRKPQVWRSAITRLAAVHLFALTVVKNTPTEYFDDVSGLLPFIADHIKKLLCRAQGHWHLPDMILYERLMGAMIWQMSENSQLEEQRSNWASNAGLPNYPRAMALWLNPGKDEFKLATDLFEKVGQPPQASHLKEHQLFYFINLLDVAMANCKRENDRDRSKKIVEYFERVMEKWPEHIRIKWKDKAAFLEQSLFEQSAEKALLKDDPIFSNSYCSKLQ